MSRYRLAYPRDTRREPSAAPLIVVALGTLVAAEILLGLVLR